MENITYENIIALLNEDSEGALNGQVLLNNKPYYARKHWSNRNIAVWEKDSINPHIGQLVFEEPDVYVDIDGTRITIFTVEAIK